MKIVPVKLLETHYDIIIGENALANSHKYIPGVIPGNKILVITTGNIYKKYGAKLWGSLKKTRKAIIFHLIPDGEVYKNQKYLFYLLNMMSKTRLQRDCGIIAFGGGVIGDLTGFAASIYMRGIKFVQCPTTLLAQVDASIGGKTAVDYYGVKNLIGSFYQPNLVLTDISVLKTLDKRQFRTGLAEIIKHGIILDPKLFNYLELNLDKALNRNPKILLTIIARSCEIKAGIVSKDEKESGIRMWLNYGHTFGHALESYFKYKIVTHGEAVAYGMRLASLVSLRLNLCGPEVVARQYDLLKRAGLFRKVPHFELNEIYQKMFLDKKARNGGIQFVLTRKIGLVSIHKSVSKSVLFSALNQLQNELRENYN